MEPLESPSTQLSGERSVLGLAKEFWDCLHHQQLLVEYFPRTAMWHPWNDVWITFIGQHRMQSGRKIPVRLLVLFNLTSLLDVGGEFAIGVVRKMRKHFITSRPCRKVKVQYVLRAPDAELIRMLCGDWSCTQQRKRLGFASSFLSLHCAGMQVLFIFCYISIYCLLVAKDSFPSYSINTVQLQQSWFSAARYLNFRHRLT